MLDLTDTGVVDTDTTEIGCRSITAGGSVGGYQIDSGAKVTFQTPLAVLTNDFAVLDGELTISSGAL